MPTLPAGKSYNIPIELYSLDSNGKLLWQHSMMEEFGRLTFPNSRTASPVIDGDLVITRGITANWGAQGPAGDDPHGVKVPCSHCGIKRL